MITINGEVSVIGKLQFSSTLLPPAADVRFDNTWWDAQEFMSWGGSTWNYTFYNGGNACLEPVSAGTNSGWTASFRPQSADFTINSGNASFDSPFTVEIRDSSDNVIGATTTTFTTADTVYEVNVPLDFTSIGDIAYVYFGYGYSFPASGYGDELWYVSNIVFNV